VAVAVNYAPGTRADYYAQSLVDLLQVPIFEKSHTRRVEEMNHDIEVIFIDVGNTLRVLVEDEPYQAQARKQIATLVGAQESPESFCERLDERYKVYRKWAFETLLEASERELWTRWMLPDWPPDKIAPLSGELTFLYRQTMGRRFAQPDAKQVVIELTKRGYRLGILSNTITEREIPQWLEEDGLSQYFPTVVLSSIFGRRKPGPEIYREAARRAGVDPARAAYVADNPSRDVPGSRRAGFGMIILMLEPAELGKKDLTGENKPDLVIHKLSELLDIFPAHQIPRDNS
jgi:putative hydrolase of the HAD superfamily